MIQTSNAFPMLPYPSCCKPVLPAVNDRMQDRPAVLKMMNLHAGNKPMEPNYRTKAAMCNTDSAML